MKPNVHTETLTHRKLKVSVRAGSQYTYVEVTPWQSPVTMASYKSYAVAEKVAKDLQEYLDNIEVPMEETCPICGGTKFVDPLPGTIGRRCVKCCQTSPE